MAKVKARQPPFRIGDVEVPAGKRMTVDLPIARLATHTPMTMPVLVIHGKYAGPCLFISATIHGDEINGIEIIRRVLKYRALKRLHGTLLCVPVVNAYGFLARSRYLPDRRDLNRSFPGLDQGLPGLAARQRLHDPYRRAGNTWHRPAHRRDPSHQPAPDPRPPR